MLSRRSPLRSGMSRYAPVNDPSKANVMCSTTRSAPVGWTVTSTLACGSVNDFAAAPGAATSATRATARSQASRRLRTATRGASRAAGSSISKYGLDSKPKIPASRFVGTDWMALSYVSTVSL